MTDFSPVKEANNVTRVLRAAGAASLPLRIKDIACEYSTAKHPEDPISLIRGDDLPGFEGALVKAPAGKSGWGIFYNNAVRSPGRINFTLAHEFGHYLIHRLAYPEGFQCNTGDFANPHSEVAEREREANQFAASLLMPLDDFRAQVDPHSRPTFDQLGACAYERYNVSLMAATLQWLSYTARRSMLVSSRDGFILWARSSKPALSSGLFFKTVARPPIEVPAKSLAAKNHSDASESGVAESGADVWLNEPCTEEVVASDQYDFVLSLLHFAADSGYRAEKVENDEKALPELDYRRFS